MTLVSGHDDRRYQLARAVAHYHAGCLRVIGSQNVALRDVRTAKKAALTCDLGMLLEEETLHATGTLHLHPPKKPRTPTTNARREILESHEEVLRYYEAQLAVWERVRELVQKVRLEPYAKEIVYAAPLLVGYLPKHGGRVDPVLAPLFTQAVTATTQHDGSIVIHAQDESLRFNTALWQDSTSTQNIGQIQSLGIEAQGDLAAGWDLERVQDLLKGISAILPFAVAALPEGALAPWPEREAPASYRNREPSLRLFEGAALFLSNRSSHYLLHDLEEVQVDPTPFLDGLDDRPLSILLSDPSEEDRPAPDWLTADEVNFPFPSNPAQRQVADALEKNAVVVVQGPPGTGKSLTIANLVAHLVSHGKSVLVTSHKQQALTVVRDKLNEMELQFLYASLIGDTSQAKRELQSQIANVRAFAGMANASRLAKQLEEIETRRAESGGRYAAVREEFIKRAEPEQVQAAGLYPQIEPYPLLPAADPAIEEDEISAVAAALRFLDGKAREHGHVWEELIGSKLAGSETLDEIGGSLRRFLDHQHARVRAATDERIKTLVDQWHPVFDADAAQIAITRIAIGDIEAGVLEPLGAVLDSAQPEADREAASALAASPVLLDDAKRGLGRLKELFNAVRELAEARTAVAADPVRRAEVVLRHGELASLVRRRGARKWLNEYAPGAAGLDADAVRRWHDFWEGWNALRTHASGLGGGLRAEIAADYDPDAAAQAIGRAERVVALAEGIVAAEQAAKTPRVTLPLSEVIDAESLDAANDALSRWMTAIAAAEADQGGNRLIASEELALLRKDLVSIDTLLDRGRVADAAAPLDHLEGVWRALPDLEERRQLLAGPTGSLKRTVAEIERAATKGEDAPPFLADIERALRLQPTLRRFTEIVANRSTRELAIELRELHTQVLEDARRLLGLRIQARILAGFRKPKFLSSLEAFKKAVSTSAKRHERFEELKTSTSFDIDILTDVFPCWIMRPEDVCRIFPLRRGIFDVVIFDEASQCNPDQALPLFARAQKVAVFGDDRQLSNEDLRRTLSSAANRALLRQAELEPLDPEGLFDQTRNSLLGLVARRQQAEVLLNEHFRCRPEIVAFSNERFYGSTLRIIRDRADDRGLGPPLIIRQLLNPLPPGSSKINYVEARAVVDELTTRLTDPRYERMTFGVLSLFREQIEHIQALVEREIDRDLLERHRVTCSTVDGFQGDERDVILYSWRFAFGSSPSIFAFTNGEGGQQRVNVALTRARHQAIHFVSASIDKFPLGAANVTPYLKHSLDPEKLLTQMEQRAHRTPGGEARRRVARALVEAGFDVREDFVACGVSIDLLAMSGNGARVAVFVDAEVDPHPDTAALHRVDAHSLLERAGWRLVRIPATDALPNAQKAVGLVADAIAGVEHARALAIEDAPYATVSVERQSIEEWLDELDVGFEEIAPEDRADYHWEVGSVEARLHGGEAVFMSDFERELYDRVAAVDELHVAPQWPSRGKFIDLVVTDVEGRRLAVEADGDQHHETSGGELIPEDIERQGLLEEAGWVFHRVRHSAFKADPDTEISALLDHLRNQPANPGLAARIRGDVIAEEAESALAADLITIARPASGAADEVAEPLATTLHDSEALEAPEAAGAEGLDKLEQVAAITTDGGANGESEKSDAFSDAGAAKPLGQLTGSEIESLLDGVFEDFEETEELSQSDADAEKDTHATASADEEQPVAADVFLANTDSIGSLGDVPLRMIAMCVGALVGLRGELPDDALVDAFSSYYRVDVPRNLRSLLTKFAWSAKGHGFVTLDRAQQIWLPGEEDTHEIEQLGDWTFNAVIDRARELLKSALPEQQVYEQLLAEIYPTPSGRVPRIVTTIAGKAIYSAQHS